MDNELQLKLLPTISCINVYMWSNDEDKLLAAELLADVDVVACTDVLLLMRFTFGHSAVDFLLLRSVIHLLGRHLF